MNSIPKPYWVRILDHISANREESKRDMSGLVAAFRDELNPGQIRSILAGLVDAGQLIRYGNGKRHCWRVATAPAVPVETAMRAASAIREKFTLSDPPDEEPRKQFCLSCGATHYKEICPECGSDAQDDL